MEVDISPITLETTKLLGRLFPAEPAPGSAAKDADSAAEEPRGHVLDSFFAADFLMPTRQRHRNSDPTVSVQEPYGVQYVRYLHRFHADQQRRDTSGTGLVDKVASELARFAQSPRWEPPMRERVLAQALVVQARIEAGAEDGAAISARLARAFWKSPRLPAVLWRCVQGHLAGEDPPVHADELEVAAELLFLFSNWAACAGEPVVDGSLSPSATQRVCLAVELFTRYSRHSRRRQTVAGTGGKSEVADVGRVQRIRLGHKALMLLDITWRLVVGDEAASQRRMATSADGKPDSQSSSRRSLCGSGVARDALRQIRESSERHPQLGVDMRKDIERLLPFVHPFDGHLTRTSQLGRFGPIRSREQMPMGGANSASLSPSTQMLLADMLGSSFSLDAKTPATDPALARLGIGVPKAVEEAARAHVQAARLTRSEREYGEWWRRLVRQRGMPLSLTMGGGRGGDVTVNYQQPQPADNTGGATRSTSAVTTNINGGNGNGGNTGNGGNSGSNASPGSSKLAFCGIVEAEDLPALEAVLDGRAAEICWPAHTDPEPAAGENTGLYRALFPLLPALSRALVRTVANWAPSERELAHSMRNMPLPSEATCLGIVAYPSWSAAQPPAAPPPSRAEPGSSLGGSNVKRLLSSAAPLLSTASDCARQTAEVSARLLAQYAQWRAVGRLLMSMLLGLQANHVLQADYLAQLLMNENFIPAVFWWLGTTDTRLLEDLPLAVRRRSFLAEYDSEKQRLDDLAAETAEADRAAVGADNGGDASGECASDTSSSSSSSSVCDWRHPWEPALLGLCDMLRSLRRLTSHNGLRKGLLYKNKALFFYTRLMRIPHPGIRRVTAELYRDLMPVVSRKHKLVNLDAMAHVYAYAPPQLSDAYWLADFSLDPQIEMHRHVELLRLLHFYHYEQFRLRLPRDPALFPSLVTQAIEGDGSAGVNESTAKAAGAISNTRRKSSLSNGSTSSQTVLPGTRRKTSAVPSTCSRQSGTMMGEHSWLLWESDLEDTLNEVYAPKT
ncbi:Factor arrest protein 11 [Coemansia sp. Benny D115]|nr:Factor arrest protein 11 [Coemansia sp. Benny D115]